MNFLREIFPKFIQTKIPIIFLFGFEYLNCNFNNFFRVLFFCYLLLIIMLCFAIFKIEWNCILSKTLLLKINHKTFQSKMKTGKC